MNKTLIAVAVAAQLIAVGLKLTNVITETWWITFFPTYLAAAFFLLTGLQSKKK